jgi:hypothetical protein
MKPVPQPPRSLFEARRPGLTSTTGMTDIEREELRRLSTCIGTEKDPEKVIEVAQQMNALLDRILARIDKPRPNTENDGQGPKA